MVKNRISTQNYIVDPITNIIDCCVHFLPTFDIDSMPAEQAKPLMLCFCLQAIEGEMDEQMCRYDELNIVGQALISYLPSFPQTTEKIQLRLEEYKNRWDRLVQQMEQQSKVVCTE